jgi:hypothetical protein
MARGGELCERGLGVREGRVGVVVPAELDQRTAEDEPGAADLSQMVCAPGEELERPARAPLGLGRLAGAELDLGERRERVALRELVVRPLGDRERPRAKACASSASPRRKAIPPGC